MNEDHPEVKLILEHLRELSDKAFEALEIARRTPGVRNTEEEEAWRVRHETFHGLWNDIRLKRHREGKA